ncbi:DUF885 family protein [Planctomycetota bacterium]
MYLHKNLIFLVFCVVVFVAVRGTATGKVETSPTSDKYEDLVSFFNEWREFQKPNLVNGVPDYTAAAMTKQRLQIPEFKKRLAAIDPSNWPIAQQVDYEIVQAEINGLEFDHRLLRPWARNPIFYAVIQMSEPDVPSREGPEIYGVLNVFEYTFPLNKKDQAIFKEKLTAIPEILSQAKQNLIEEAGDLWLFGIRQKRGESANLASLARRWEDSNPDLATLARQAQVAVDDFADWLEKKRQGMKAYSGIGIAEYSRYMKEVHLVPYSWQEQVELIERELERSLASLALEEHHNRHLPPLKPAGSLKEMQDRMKKSVAEFMGFLRTEEIFTVPEYMRLNDGVASYLPPERRDFFSEINYYDCMPLLCHQIHWLEKQRELRNTHPIRGMALLYNIWDSRAEGLATGFEEQMMQAGILEKNPRVRELVYIMLAFRCIRALGGLKLHSGEWTLEEAIDYAVKKTPRGFLRPDSNTIRTDYAIYLAQPGYGTSYVVGKNQLEKLIADRAAQLGERFRLKDFLDDYFARGVIPASLLRWEMTGFDDEMQKLRK